MPSKIPPRARFASIARSGYDVDDKGRTRLWIQYRGHTDFEWADQEQANYLGKEMFAHKKVSAQFAPVVSEKSRKRGSSCLKASSGFLAGVVLFGVIIWLATSGWAMFYAHWMYGNKPYSTRAENCMLSNDPYDITAFVKNSSLVIITLDDKNGKIARFTPNVYANSDQLRLTCEDVNNDGKMDISIDIQGSIAILYGDGNGDLSPIPPSK